MKVRKEKTVSRKRREKGLKSVEIGNEKDCRQFRFRGRRSELA